MVDWGIAAEPLSRSLPTHPATIYPRAKTLVIVLTKCSVPGTLVRVLGTREINEKKTNTQYCSGGQEVQSVPAAEGSRVLVDSPADRTSCRARANPCRTSQG